MILQTSVLPALQHGGGGSSRSLVRKKGGERVGAALMPEDLRFGVQKHLEDTEHSICKILQHFPFRI